jgi:hypothetical protein
LIQGRVDEMCARRVAICAVLAAVSAGCEDSGREGWSFRIELRDPESRSQREVGILEHGLQRIPRALGTVVTPIGQFTPPPPPGFGAPIEEGEFWPSRTNADGTVSFFSEPERGAYLTPAWIRENTRTTRAACDADAFLASEDLARGWYRAAFDARRRGTPPDWMWLADRQVWLSPGKSGDYLRDGQ